MRKMKKLSAVMVCLALTVLLFAGCGVNNQAATADTPDVLGPAIMYDGNVYCTTGKQVSYEVDDNAVIGEITSVVPLNQWPKKEGEANFGETGATYALVQEELVVLVENEWTLFELRTDE